MEQPHPFESMKRLNPDLTNKQNDPHLPSNLWNNFEFPKFSLDQSSSYVYASHCYSQNHSYSFGFEIPNFSLNYEQRPFGLLSSGGSDWMDAPNLMKGQSLQVVDIHKSENIKCDGGKQH